MKKTKNKKKINSYLIKMFAVRSTPVVAPLLGGPKFAVPAQKTTPAGIYVSGGNNISQGNNVQPLPYHFGINCLNGQGPALANY